MTTLSIKDSLPDPDVEGIFHLEKRFADGKVEVVTHECNLITRASKAFLLLGIYQDGVISDPVKTLHIGTGGCIDPAGKFPKKEDPLQTGLHTEILSIPAVPVPSTTEVAVTFLADVDQTQANGQRINEAGLFKSLGGIFNVKNHPAVTKAPEFSLHYAWTIRFK